MNAVHVQFLSSHLDQVLAQVAADHEPTIITRDDGENLVVLSYADFAALEETAYLLRSPAMAARLRDSLESMQRGGGQGRDLIDES